MKENLFYKLEPLLQLKLNKLLEDGWIEKIKNSPRELVKDLGAKLEKMNGDERAPKWYMNSNTKGNYIYADFSFKDRQSALIAASILYFLEESSDHHSESLFRSFSGLKVELCTHSPNYGVTEVDLSFAAALTALLSN